MIQQDVSYQALSIARMLDRLGPGRYNIALIMPKSSTDRWTIEISQRILHKELGAEPDSSSRPSAPDFEVIQEGDASTPPAERKTP